jgi:hypothetical protein
MLLADLLTCSVMWVLFRAVMEPATWISAHWLLARLLENIHPSGTVIVVMDCCRALTPTLAAHIPDRVIDHRDSGSVG